MPASLMDIVLLLLLALPLLAGAGDAEMWHVGKGMSPGDWAAYYVCDESGRLHAVNGSCYHLRLDFVALLEAHDGPAWVVQAEAYEGSYRSYHVFLLNPDTLLIRTDYTGSEFAGSFADTVMWLGQFADDDRPKPLQVGSVWGGVRSTMNQESDVIVSFRDGFQLGNRTLDTYALTYGVFERSIISVAPCLPFPVAGVAYDPDRPADSPRPLHAYELVGYGSERCHLAP